MVSPSAFFLPSLELPTNSGHSPREFAIPVVLLTVVCSFPLLWPAVSGRAEQGMGSVRIAPSKGTLQLRWQRRKDRVSTECLLTGYGANSTKSSPGNPLGNNQVCAQLPTPAVKTQGLFKGSLMTTLL